MIKRIVKKLLEYWDIYGGVLTTITIALIVHFEKAMMDKLTSFTSMLLVITSVYVYIKVYYKREKKNILDALILSNSPFGAIYPIAKSKDIQNKYKKIKENKKKMDIKKKLYTIFNNKWSIISILFSTLEVVFLVAVSYLGKVNELFPYLNQTQRTIVAVAISCVILVPQIYTTITKYGLESYAQIIERKKKSLKDTDSKDPVNAELDSPEETEENNDPYNSLISSLNDTVKETNERIELNLAKMEELTSKIDKLQMLKKLVGTLPASSEKALNEYMVESNKIKLELNNDTSYVASINEKIKAIETLKE